ncbi:MAG: hypothetical protein AB1589_41270 [Cyanobacteriota bacterium]
MNLTIAFSQQTIKRRSHLIVQGKKEAIALSTLHTGAIALNSPNCAISRVDILSRDYRQVSSHFVGMRKRCADKSVR